MEPKELIECIKKGYKVELSNADLLLLIAKMADDLNNCHLRIDRMAKNYKILEKTDDYISLGRLKESLSKIRRRIFKLENDNNRNNNQD